MGKEEVEERHSYCRRAAMSDFFAVDARTYIKIVVFRVHSSQ